MAFIAVVVNQPVLGLISGLIPCGFAPLVTILGRTGHRGQWLAAGLASFVAAGALFALAWAGSTVEHLAADPEMASRGNLSFAVIALMLLLSTIGAFLAAAFTPRG